MEEKIKNGRIVDWFDFLFCPIVSRAIFYGFSAWIAAADEVEKELQCCNTQIEDLDCERKMGLNQNMIFLLLNEWMNEFKIGVVWIW